MFNSLAIISIAFLAAAFAEHHWHGSESDGRPLCDCPDMKHCLQSKLDEYDQMRTSCDQQCSTQLPHYGEMRQCLKAKWDKTDEMLQKMLNCVTTGEHNMCQNITQKHEDSEEKHTEHGDEEKPKMEIVEELKPYVDCMKTCMNASEDQAHHEKYDRKGKHRHGSGHGWKHFTRQMWSGLWKCKKTLSCKLEHDAKKASISNCMNSTGVDRDAYCTVKRDFCNCARQVLGKTEEEMPCNWDDEESAEPHAALTTAAHGHE